MLCEKIKRDCYAETYLTFLFNVNGLLIRSENVYRDLETVLEELCKFLGAQYSMITIVDGKEEKIAINAAYGLTEEEKNRGIYQVGEGIVGEVAETGKPVVINDITKDEKFLNKTGIHPPEGVSMAFICVPIVDKNKIMGTLSVHKNHQGIVAGLSPEINFLNIVGTLIARKVALRRRQQEEIESLRRENERLRFRKPFKPDNIIGNSSLMRDVYGLIERVAPTNTTVMIRGESGVGKELIAEAIHNYSLRRSGPFIKVNCSALSETLIENELFGHEKGSYTGANASYLGRFEMADGGTIFLDEIGDVPLSVQVKLLRVLQEKQVERIGGNRTLNVDVRIVTATNRNLEKMVKEGNFRADLYYRLNVFPIYVPALRERCADIPILTDHFIEKKNKRNKMDVKRITGGAMDILMSYNWPGNIRELENVIERAMILSADGVIHSYNLFSVIQAGPVTGNLTKGVLNNILEQVEKQMVVDTLVLMKGNLTASAEKLGVTRRVMGILIKKHGIEIKKYKQNSDYGYTTASA